VAEEKKMVSGVMGRLPNKGRDFDPIKDIHRVSGKPRLHKVPKAYRGGNVLKSLFCYTR
jgi:hypothetical protein